jgi:hypothetical protein
MVDYGWIAPLKAAPTIRAAIDRSLALNPDSAEAQASLGFFRYLIDWDPIATERAFQRALTLEPSLATAHH